jgi:uncharacterized membrane protein
MTQRKWVRARQRFAKRKNVKGKIKKIVVRLVTMRNCAKKTAEYEGIPVPAVNVAATVMLIITVQSLKGGKGVGEKGGGVE